MISLFKGPLISIFRIISVGCSTNLNFPLLTSNQNKESPKQPISMKRGSKFVRHSTEIIWQSKIKGPLPWQRLILHYWPVIFLKFDFCNTKKQKCLWIQTLEKLMRYPNRSLPLLLQPSNRFRLQPHRVWNIELCPEQLVGSFTGRKI